MRFTTIFLALALASCLLHSLDISYHSAAASVALHGSCQQQCRAAYASQDPCTADRECLWIGATCDERCGRFLAPDQCTARNHCEWLTATQTCNRTCLSLTVADCQALADNFNCFLSTTGDRCLVTCRNIKDKAVCATRAPACNWKATGSLAASCAVGCGATYPTDEQKVGCSNDASCVWLSAPVGKAACYDACSTLAGDAAACTAQRHCVWTGKLCTERCSAKYGRDTENCALDARCAVFQTSVSPQAPANAAACDNACTSDLSGFTSESLCNAEYRCQWDYKSNKCQLACRYFASQVSCEESSTGGSYCEWTALSACQPRCGDIRKGISISSTSSLASLCRARGGHCVYAETGGCRLRCGELHASGTRNVSLDACRNDVACQVINGDLCVDSCAGLDVDVGSCRASPICREVTGVAAGRTCGNRCELAANSAADCDKLHDCQWLSLLGRCSEKCSALVSEAACAATACEWLPSEASFVGSNMSCVVRCAALSPTECVSVPYCFKTPFGDACLPRCSLYNATTCKRHERCLLQTADVAASRKDSRATQLCIESCSLRYALSEVGCNSDTRCSFYGRLGCRESCLNAADAVTCRSLVYCWFDADASTCRPRCDAKYRTSGAACDSDPQCESMPAACHVRCSLLKAASCSEQARDCKWADGECRHRCEGIFAPRSSDTLATAAAACQAVAGCEWLPMSRRCSERCDSAKTTADCAATHTLCVWTPIMTFDSLTNGVVKSSSRGACGYPCGMRGRDPASCFASSPQCEWFHGVGLCQAACAYGASSIAACLLRAPFCEWVGAAANLDVPPSVSNNSFNVLSTCIQTCSSRSGSTACLADNTCEIAMMAPNLPSASTSSLTLTTTCATRCSIMGYEACSGSSHCLWRSSAGLQRLYGTAGRCITNCAVRSPTTCTLDSRCMLLVGDRCSPNCASLANAAACTLSDCVWSNRTALCYPSCATSYFGETSSTYEQRCKADPSGRCEWDAAQQTCREGCREFPSLQDHVNSGLCPRIYCDVTTNEEYRASVPTCAPRCGLRVGTVACVSSPGCEVHPNDANRCVLQCSGFTTAATCPSRLCSFRDAGGSSSAVCTLSCLNRYRGNETACVADSNCALITMLTTSGSAGPTNTFCAEQCNRFSYALCGAQAHCEWSSASNGCVRSCAATFVNQATCDASSTTPRCQWLQSAGACAKRCDALQANECGAPLSAAVHCTWTPQDTCVVLCGARYARTSNATTAESRILAMSGLCASDQTNCFFDMASSTCQQQCATGTTVNCGIGAFFHCGWTEGAARCVRKCAAAYGTNASACRQDVDCEWVDESVCDIKCSLRVSLATASSARCLSFNCAFNAATRVCLRSCYSRLKGDCQPTSECTWVNEACRPTCNTLDAATCALDPRCLAVGDRCQADCGSLTASGATACSSVAGGVCQWLYNNASSSAAPVDVNITATGRCVNNCSTATQQPNCNVLSHCSWLSSVVTNGALQPPRCVTKCGSLFTPNAAEFLKRCRSNSMCVAATTAAAPLSSSSALQCHEDCSLVSQPSLCTSLAHCYFVPMSQRCLTRCFRRYPSQKECLSDVSNCLWDATSMTCRDQCTGLSQDACTGPCTFHDLARQCYPTCASYYNGAPEGACALDANCAIWSAAGAPARCLQKCSLFGVENCGVKAEASHCVMMGTRCQTRCQIRYGPSSPGSSVDTAKCAADAACDVVNVIDDSSGQPSSNSSATVVQRCDQKCVTLLSPAACISTSTCLWDNVSGACYLQCSAKYGTDLDGCSKEPAFCMASAGGRCADRCHLMSGEKQCSRFSHCAWKGTRCDVRCVVSYAGATATACISLLTSGDECTWYGPPTTGSCAERCRTHQTESACNALAGATCSWTPGGGGVRSSCRVRCATLYLPAACANEALNCEWDAQLSACVGKCTVLTTEAACVATGVAAADALCQWLPRSLQCVNACRRKRATDRRGCNYDPHCNYFGFVPPPNVAVSSFTGPALPQPNKCDVRCELRDAAACGLDPNSCSWHPGLRVCLRACSAIYGSYSAPCDGDGDCQWFAAAGMCGPKCSVYATVGLAASDLPLACQRASAGLCDWYAATGTCERKCSETFALQTSADQCVQDRKCEWRLASKSCDRKCSSRTAGWRSCQRADDVSDQAGGCDWVAPNRTAELSFRTVGLDLTASVEAIRGAITPASRAAPLDVTTRLRRVDCGSAVLDLSVLGTYDDVQQAIETASVLADHAAVTMARDVRQLTLHDGIPVSDLGLVTSSSSSSSSLGSNNAASAKNSAQRSTAQAFRATVCWTAALSLLFVAWALLA